MIKKSYGFTHIKETENYLVISHSGNMGNKIKDVDNNLKKMGYSSIEEMKCKCKAFAEKGSPDYYYQITFNK